MSRRTTHVARHLITPGGALLGWTPGGRAHVYDRSANRLGQALPGAPLTVTAEVAVFATPTGAALHQVVRG
ncbi:hypothetical protein [Saccharothrix deserti]|uniref:hypothetical protein n=1 Tax=Saccharothrix deserti TaxID=2593674 RepID=UPI00131BD9FE|nr:hypothetical protein [Saccharothrix deserti]